MITKITISQSSVLSIDLTGLNPASYIANRMIEATQHAKSLHKEAPHIYRRRNHNNRRRYLNNSIHTPKY